MSNAIHRYSLFITHYQFPMTDQEQLAQFCHELGDKQPYKTEFDDQGHLIKLDLAGLDLTSLPPTIGQFSHLRILMLGNFPGGNLLTELPPEIWQLTNLQTLRLDNNQFSELPPEIRQLTNLQRLYLRNNQFSELPPEIWQLTNLQQLWLTNNQFSELPPQIGQLANLQELGLGNNQFSKLPHEIWQLTNLQHFVLGNNQFSKLPSKIRQLTNLQRLYLQNNRFSKLPSEIWQLISLQVINLSNNQFRKLPPEIGQLTNLQTLWLHNNPLKQLPPEIGQLTNLQRLDLDNNQLKRLPPEIGQLTSLQELDLDNNPSLRTPPPEIVRRGLVDILDYQRALQVGSVMRYEAKLLLVGEGECGKSSLLAALQDEPFVARRDTTHGIAIQSLTLPPLTLHVWDFGGQHIYHTTHQFFMTQRSLYLLVWSTRKDTEQARLDHWLRHIQVIAPQAKVLLVATHIDVYPADFNYGRYQAAYPDLLVGHVGVSNQTGEGIEQLRQLIIQHAQQLPVMEQAWPTTWVEAERKLTSPASCGDKPYIDLSHFTALCQEAGVTAEIAQDALGSYLHDLGKILYFGDDADLRDFVVLQPNWLTEAMSKVLDDKRLTSAHGILNHQELRRIWADYAPELHPRFIRLMEKFWISYRFERESPNQTHTYSLVPLRLPHQLPPDMPAWAEVVGQQPEIRMVFKFINFVPPGLMSWFIVLNRHYAIGDTPQEALKWAWREGVRLHYQGHFAEANLNPSTGELWLRVCGPAPSNFFNLLQDNINDRILTHIFEGLNYQRFVPCNCQPGCAYLHDYMTLAEHKELNILEIRCGKKPFKPVSVLTLLEGIHPISRDQVEAQLVLLTQEDSPTSQISQQIQQNQQLLQRWIRQEWQRDLANLTAECPSVVYIMKAERHTLNPQNLFSEPYKLYLMCQHLGDHHLPKGHTGYPLPMAKAWWQEVAPWLKQLADYLRYIPKGGIILEAYDESLFKAHEMSLKLTEATSDMLGSLEAEDKLSDFKHKLYTPIEVEGPALRALHKFLNENDPNQHWGGLSKVFTADNDILWLCDEHRHLYEL